MKKRIYAVLMLMACCAHTLDAKNGGRGRGGGSARRAAAQAAQNRSNAIARRAASQAAQRRSGSMAGGSPSRVPRSVPAPMDRGPQRGPSARPERSMPQVQADRPSPVERIARPERPSLAERPRAERPERARIADRADRPERPRIGRADRDEEDRPSRRPSRAAERARERADEQRSRAERGLGRREQAEDRAERARAREQRAEDRERRAQRAEERRQREDRGPAEAPERGAPGQDLSPEQRKELERKPAVSQVNQFAEKKIAQNPKLQAEVRQAHTKWRTDRSVRRRWHSDWRKYSYYHSHGHFHFDTFIHFAFFAPWYLFPFTFYPTFFDYYPVYRVRLGWFSYPIYWDYGYAREIELVRYVEREDFDAAIDRLERRLDELENDLLEQQNKGTLDEQSETALRARISEIIWLLNDLKQIIQEEARISRGRKNQLVRRINDIKDIGHNLMNYFEG